MLSSVGVVQIEVKAQAIVTKDVVIANLREQLLSAHKDYTVKTAWSVVYTHS